MITLFMGMPGAGKSLAIHDWIRARPDHRYVVVEHSDEWAASAKHWRGQPPRNIVDVWEQRGADAIVAQFRANRLPPGGLFRCVRMDAWDVCRLAIALGPAVYVDDEIDIAGAQTTWLQHGNPLKEFVHRGRHLINARCEVVEGHIFGACRRPQNVARDLADLCAQKFVFRMQGDLAGARLIRDGTIDKEDWPRIQQLPNCHCFHWPSREWMEIEAWT